VILTLRFLTLADSFQHVLSKKHRKFAVTADHWLELDQLLAQLSRD
jgi:regulatory subunit for Cdc7p protein kinase